MEALIGSTFLHSGAASALGMGIEYRAGSVELAGNISRKPWDSEALSRAFYATATLCERLGILPAGGAGVLRSIFQTAGGGIRAPDGQRLAVGGPLRPQDWGPQTGLSRERQEPDQSQEAPALEPSVAMPEVPISDVHAVGRVNLPSAGTPELSAENPAMPRPQALPPHSKPAGTGLLSRHERRQRRIVREISKLLGGYTFSNVDLLVEALTHCSYSIGPCNQVCAP